MADALQIDRRLLGRFALQTRASQFYTILGLEPVGEEALLAACPHLVVFHPLFDNPQEEGQQATHCAQPAEAPLPSALGVPAEPAPPLASEPQFAGWSWARLPARQWAGGYWDHPGEPTYTRLWQKEHRKMTADGEAIPRQYQHLQLLWEEALFSGRPNWKQLQRWHEELCGWEALLAGLEWEDLG